MDKEGQNTNAPDFEANVFNSDSIGNRATPEYFSNVVGGKKDKEKVIEKRTQQSRKRLFIVLGAISALLLIVMFTALIINFNTKPHGSRTDEAMPSNMSEIEERAYKVVYSGDEDGYTNALYYLNDMISDMEDLNLSPDLIFAVYAVRARITFQGGAREVAVEEALRLADEANTDIQKLYAYHELFYMYNQMGETDKRDFYGDLLAELDVDLEKDAIGGIADEDDENADEEAKSDDTIIIEEDENAEEEPEYEEQPEEGYEEYYDEYDEYEDYGDENE